MDDASACSPLPADVAELRRLLADRERELARFGAAVAERDQKILELTQQRDDMTQQRDDVTQQRDEMTRQRNEFYVENLRLQVRLAKALKQCYGPRADRVADPAQLLLDFGQSLEASPIRPEDVPAEKKSADRPSRRVKTRGRRDLAKLDHLPQIEQVYELSAELCRCPQCREPREKIGERVSYTVEYVPGYFLRVRHVQYKYACRSCEGDGRNPCIGLAAKTGGSPIDKGMPGPSLLAYVAASKYADYLPLHRLQGIFERSGFELDRSTMCLWMADVARIVRPAYERMAQRVRRSHVLATDDTTMPLLRPEKTRKARMWIYRGNADHPYNVFDFTVSRGRDGPGRFLQDFQGTLLADAYGGYDGVVLTQELPRAGCWAHARRKFVDAQNTAPEVAGTILRLIDALFHYEREWSALDAEERLRRRGEQARPAIESLRGLLLEQKERLLPKHPLVEAVSYALNQWAELTLFLADGAVPIHNNLAEQEMKRIALLRKNALFVGSERGGETAAILSSLTSTCRRHGIDPHLYLAQLLVNLPHVPDDQLDAWLPDEWKKSPWSVAAVGSPTE